MPNRTSDIRTYFSEEGATFYDREQQYSKLIRFTFKQISRGVENNRNKTGTIPPIEFFINQVVFALGKIIEESFVNQPFGAQHQVNIFSRRDGKRRINLAF